VITIPPLKPFAPFSHDDGGLLSAVFDPLNPGAGPGIPYFRGLWGVTFHAPSPGLNAQNHYGYLADMKKKHGDPEPVWYCAWAAGVYSSMPATAYAAPAVVPRPYEMSVGGNNEIKMLFESRYGRCLLNVGFNPYFSDFLFNRSYKSIVRLLAGPAVVVRVVPAVDEAFPDSPAVS